MNRVLCHRSSLDAIASSLLAMYSAPAAGKKDGCSDCAVGATSQDTCGSRPALASVSNQPAVPFRIPRCHSGEAAGALPNCLNQASALSS